MAKRAIGIDLGSSYLRAVQVARNEQELRIEKVFTAQVRRSTDSLPNALTSLVSRYGFDRKAPIAVSVPNDAVFFRNLETDSDNVVQIRRRELSVFDNSFPVPAGGIVTQIYSLRQLPDGGCSVLVVAAKKQVLQQKYDLLTQAELVPDMAETAIFAMHSAVAANYPEITTGIAAIVCLGESCLTVAVMQDNTILIVRNLRLADDSESEEGAFERQTAEILLREVALSWRKVLQTEFGGDSRIFLVVQAGVSEELKDAVVEKLSCRMIVVDPYINVKPPPEGRANDSICLAEGLALRILAPEKAAGVNFLKASAAEPGPPLNFKREMTICATLAGAIVVLLLAALWGRWFLMAREYRYIKSEIIKVFQNTLPEEKNIMVPLRQLSEKIDLLKKDYQLFASFYPTGMSALDVLHELSTGMPSQRGFKVDDVFIAPESVQINGKCDSPGAMYEWQKILQDVPGFAFVDVYPRESLENGVASFTLSISSEKSSDTTVGARQTESISRRQ